LSTGLLFTFLQIQHVLLQCPPVAVAIAKIKQDGGFENMTNKIEFNIVELSDLMGWDSSPVKKELKLLEWNLGQLSLSEKNCFGLQITLFYFLFINHFGYFR